MIDYIIAFRVFLVWQAHTFCPRFKLQLPLAPNYWRNLGLRTFLLMACAGDL
jgi:hypothetical protein